MATRAFGANVDRLIRRTTIVYSADDIRRNITLRLNDGLPCDLEMGADITTERGFTIPGELASFSLDGGTTFRLFVGADVASLFDFRGRELTDGSGPSSLRNLAVVVKAGVTVTTAFVVRQTFAASDLESALTLDQVSIDASAGTMVNVFGMGSDGTRARVVATGMALTAVENMFSTGSNLTAWVGCRFTDIIVIGIGFTPMTIGLGSTSPSFAECVFLRISGAITIDTGSNSYETLWASVAGDSTGGFITHNATGGKPQTLLRVSGFTPRTLSVDDIDLDNIAGGGGGATPTAATITVPYEMQEQTATVIDASATALSKVMVLWGNTADTDDNQPSSSNVTFSAVGAAGSISVTVSDNGAEMVGGVYKILYILG
jgi:hypothetical protein